MLQPSSTLTQRTIYDYTPISSSAECGPKHVKGLHAGSKTKSGRGSDKKNIPCYAPRVALFPPYSAPMVVVASAGVSGLNRGVREGDSAPGT